MFLNKKATGAAAAIAILLISHASMAQEQGLSPSSGSAALYSGGIGDDEINYIKSIEHQYSAKLLFTEANGVFLADLPVTVKNKEGETVVSTVTKGPILLLDLPNGTYTVVASEGDVSREQKISVSGHSLRTFQFRFPTSDPREDDRTYSE